MSEITIYWYSSFVSIIRYTALATSSQSVHVLSTVALTTAWDVT